MRPKTHIKFWLSGLLNIIRFHRHLHNRYLYGYPLSIVVAAILYTIVFSTLTILKHHNFQTYGWDLGIYMQALYTTAFHGKLLYYTLECHSNPSCSLFGVHFSPFLFLLVPIYRLLPYAETLLVLQSLFIALGSLIVYKLAKIVLKQEKIAVALSLAYLLYTPLHVMNWFDFHLQAFIPFLVLSAYYHFIRSSYFRSLIYIILALSTFEVMPILIFPLGMYALVKNFKDRRGLIYALTIMTLCVLWFALSLSVIHSFNPKRLENYVNPWGKFGSSPTEVIYNVLTKPYDALQHFLTYDALHKGLYMLWLLLPLFFTPLMAPLEFFTLVMPWPTLAFLSQFPTLPGGYLGLQYGGFVVGQIFTAAIEGLKRTLHKAPEDIKRWFLRLSCKNILVASTIVLLFMNPYSPIPEVRGLYVGGVPEPSERKLLLREVLALIPENASVLTQNDILPHLANRLELYSVSASLSPDFILLDLKSRWSSLPIVIAIGSEDPLSSSIKKLNKYALIASADGIVLYHRNGGHLKLFKPYIAHFGYRDLPIERGSIIPCPSSPYGAILASDTSSSLYPFWWHGPWASLPPGSYVATFRMRVDEEVEGYLLTLLVTSKGGTEVIARKQLYGFELAPGEWTDVRLNLSLRHPMSGIELLGVLPSNLTRIYLDHIRVEQLSAVAHETSGDLDFNFMNLLTTGSIANGVITMKDADVVYGPYTRLNPGNYTALFWVKVSNVDRGSLIFDVVKDKGATTIAKLVVNGSDVALGQWSRFALDFSLNEEVHDVEFRVRASGCEALFAKVEVVRR